MQRKVFPAVLVLLSVLTLFTVFGFAPTVSAHTASVTYRHHQTHTLKPNIYTCSFNGGNYDVDIDSNSSGNHYYCGTGYTGLYITNVFNVYNNSAWYVWILYYPAHAFCWIQPADDGQWLSGNGVLITQLDINAKQGSQCPH